MYITVPKPNHKTYGWLSNDSHFGFIINSLYYPTVTHYIESKKFEGLNYEEEIRKTKTAIAAKHKTRSREAMIISTMPKDEKKKLEEIEDLETNMYIKRETIYGRKRSWRSIIVSE